MSRANRLEALLSHESTEMVSLHYKSLFIIKY